MLELITNHALAMSSARLVNFQLLAVEANKFCGFLDEGPFGFSLAFLDNGSFSLTFLDDRSFSSTFLANDEDKVACFDVFDIQAADAGVAHSSYLRFFEHFSHLLTK